MNEHEPVYSIKSHESIQPSLKAFNDGQDAVSFTKLRSVPYGTSKKLKAVRSCCWTGSYLTVRLGRHSTCVFSLPVAIRYQLPQYRSIVLPIFSVCEMINWLLDCAHLLRRWHFTQMAVLHSDCEKRTYCRSFTDPKIWSQNLSDSRYNDFVAAISKYF